MQELDLEIWLRSGKHNANTDALSRHPLPVEESVDASPHNQVVAAVIPLNEEGLPELQGADPELSKVFQYLERGILPEDQNGAKKLALTESQYLIKCAVLYHVENGGTLQVIPTAYHCENLFQEAHGAPYMVLTWVISRCSVSYVDTTGGLACGQTSPNGPVPAKFALHKALDVRCDPHYLPYW